MIHVEWYNKKIKTSRQNIAFSKLEKLELLTKRIVTKICVKNIILNYDCHDNYNYGVKIIIKKCISKVKKMLYSLQ